MIKDVMIYIRSEQESEGEDSAITQEVPGIISKQDDKIFLRYEEEMEGASDKVKTLLKIQGTTLHLKRTGGVRTTMNFQPHMVTTSEYFMPMGQLHFKVYTEELVILSEEESLEIMLRYTLSSEEEVLSKNTLSIRVV